MIVAPLLSQRQVTVVDYGTIMSMIEEKNIGEVQIEDYAIVFTDKDNTAIYKTGIMEDPDLTQRLYDSGAKFAREITEPMSPILSLLLSVGIPLLIFVGLGQYMNKKLMEQAGGRATYGRTRILGQVPEKLHQRVAVFLGAREEVERVTAYHLEEDGGRC